MTTASVGYAEIDASMLSSADRLPSVCSRHGEDANERVDVGVLSKPPPRPGPKILRLPWGGVISMINDVAWFMMNLKVTKVSGWPVCARCGQRRRTARTVTRILLWGGLISFVASLVGSLVYRSVTEEFAPSWVLAPMLGGVAAMLLSAASASWSRYDRISRAATSEDGKTVWFARPHPRFVDQMRATFGTQWRVQAQAPEQPPRLH